MISLIKSLRQENDPLSVEKIGTVFETMVRALEANCGILVFREGTDSFIESASFGYESDFYYSFLARGKGNFEAIATSEDIVTFSSNQFPLYSKNSICAASIRIAYREEMFGFILLEFPKEISVTQQTLLQMLSEKIASLYISKSKVTPFLEDSSNQEKGINYDLFDSIIDRPIEFINSMKTNRFANIQGSIGSGKKFFVKYVYNKLALQGKIIYLNSLPDQIVKLEKSIQDWKYLAGNGILVIENVASFTMGQQRVFFETIKDTSLEPRIFFLDDLTRHTEDYQPFWNLLSQHSIQMPNLLSLNRDKLRIVIDLLFSQLKQINHRFEMTLSEDAYDFLYNYPYKENLRDLRNLLEQAIIRSKENIIKKEFYLKINNSKIKSLDFQNEEDLDLRKGVQALERQKILLANKIFSGNQIRMAKALGVSRGSLQYKMKQLEL